MSEQRIKAAWESYRTEVIPKNAGQTQIIECRRAFYAGAGALLGVILWALEPGTEATEEYLKMMEQISAELTTFKNDVRGGRA